MSASRLIIGSFDLSVCSRIFSPLSIVLGIMLMAKAQKGFGHVIVRLFFEHFFKGFDGLLQLQFMEVEIAKPDFRQDIFRIEQLCRSE